MVSYNRDTREVQAKLDVLRYAVQFTGLNIQLKNEITKNANWWWRIDTDSFVEVLLVIDQPAQHLTASLSRNL
jgi:hypothetical protein